MLPLFCKEDIRQLPLPFSAGHLTPYYVKLYFHINTVSLIVIMNEHSVNSFPAKRQKILYKIIMKFFSIREISCFFENTFPQKNLQVIKSEKNSSLISIRFSFKRGRGFVKGCLQRKTFRQSSFLTRDVYRLVRCNK